MFQRCEVYESYSLDTTFSAVPFVRQVLRVHRGLGAAEMKGFGATLATNEPTLTEARLAIVIIGLCVCIHHREK